MGFDNNTKLIKSETFIMLIARFIKNNTPQIALLTPFVIALISSVGNFFIYLYKKGYYDYFNLDNNFIVFNRPTIIYELITAGITSLIYWVYSIFSLRMFYKRNLFMKVVCFFIIPFSISFIFVCYSSKQVLFNNTVTLVAVIIMCTLFIFLQWPLIYIFGKGMAGAINDDVLEQYNKEKLEKKNLKMQKKEKNKKATNSKKNNKFKQTEKEIFATIIMLGAILLYIFGTHYFGYYYAKNEKQFDIVKIENSNYAVIATDGNQFILEFCDVSKDNKSVAIDTNTYMKVDCKNLTLHRYNFESVLRK